VHNPSSHDYIASQSLQPEQAYVCVKESTIPEAGESLFARTNLEEGQIVSFYNGIYMALTQGGR